MRKTLVFLSLVILTFTLKAQEVLKDFSFEKGKFYKIEFKDSDATVVGEYLEQTNDFIVLRTAVVERMEISWAKIKSITLVDAPNPNEWFENLGSSRYFLNPSGYALGKGQWEYRNHYLLFNSIHGGLTKNLSIGGGFEFISTFAAGNPIHFVTANYKINLGDRLNLGTGIVYLGVLESYNTFSVFIPNVIVTYGSPDHHFTVGYNIPVTRESNEENYFTFSGQTRISKRISLLSDNFSMSSEFNTMLYMYGIRILGEKTTIDIALINNSDIVDEIGIGYPFVGFSARF